jgi:hypothetical protein
MRLTAKSASFLVSNLAADRLPQLLLRDPAGNRAMHRQSNKHNNYRCSDGESIEPWEYHDEQREQYSNRPLKPS